MNEALVFAEHPFFGFFGSFHTNTIPCDTVKKMVASKEYFCTDKAPNLTKLVLAVRELFCPTVRIAEECIQYLAHIHEDSSICKGAMKRLKQLNLNPMVTFKVEIKGESENLQFIYKVVFYEVTKNRTKEVILTKLDATVASPRVIIPYLNKLEAIHKNQLRAKTVFERKEFTRKDNYLEQLSKDKVIDLFGTYGHSKKFKTMVSFIFDDIPLIPIIEEIIAGLNKVHPAKVYFRLIDDPQQAGIKHLVVESLGEVYFLRTIDSLRELRCNEAYINTYLCPPKPRFIAKYLRDSIYCDYPKQAAEKRPIPNIKLKGEHTFIATCSGALVGFLTNGPKGAITGGLLFGGCAEMMRQHQEDDRPYYYFPALT
ncbi:hypothetical protein D5R81_13440 [Parashewanella spongiae]|uniref:Uncharacterized protein n=1 Tax=Parashewanella spongiae TaxID=342950 RepID=A0A3A6THQ4_9GAMM|nr:hypothetical protein [Parashewanella spongiae]MCL1079370.1 hypothetical protein [Parashewanella spongiae]RJY11115.1 hypothetical protein D5R81_13440 [Parashewanella spongiae]